MKLPHLDKLIIERDKIAGYLLDLAHPYGASKARFFRMYGFSAGNWGILAQALRDHGPRKRSKPDDRDRIRTAL